MLLEKIFQPTWLYIKQHNVTGLKYFGKTVRKDPIKYKGSGTYWNRHIDKHGSDITTVWLQLFTSKDELIKFALTFSKENNIVESTEWANLEFEDGLSGGGFFRKNTPETIKKRSISNTGKKRTPEQIANIRKGQSAAPKPSNEELQRRIALYAPKTSVALKGVAKSQEHRENLSKSLTGKYKGVPKSDTAKQNMRKPKSEEHRKAISEGRKAKYAAIRAKS